MISQQGSEETGVSDNGRYAKHAIAKGLSINFAGAMGVSGFRRWIYSANRRALRALLLTSAVLLGATLLTSCSTTDSHSPRQALDLGMTLEEPVRMRFSGKGAGAGMMLMSSMGAMGIAIGVAIDEGIGKDIDTTANAAGFNVSGIFTDAVQAQWLALDSLEGIERSVKYADHLPRPLAVTIQRYGFITQSGDNDPVAPQLHIHYIDAKGLAHVIKYPEEFEESDIVTWPLDSIKVEGDPILDMHRQAAERVANRIFFPVQAKENTTASAE